MTARLLDGVAGKLGYARLTVVYEAVKPRIPTYRIQKLKLDELSSTRRGPGGPYFVSEYDSRTVGLVNKTKGGWERVKKFLKIFCNQAFGLFSGVV